MRATLVDVARGDQHVSRKDSDAMTATAPDYVARWVVTLNARRLVNYHPTQGAAPMPSEKPAATIRPAAQEKMLEVLRASLSADGWRASPEAHFTANTQIVALGALGSIS